MRRYIVTTKEVLTTSVEVEADNKDEAALTATMRMVDALTEEGIELCDAELRSLHIALSENQ